MKTILLDMDGVLVDFVGDACAVLGVDPSVAKSWNFFNDLGMSEPEFWSRIDKVGESFWAGVSEHEWCDELLELANSFGNVVISSAPSRSPYSSSGKVRWLKNKFGEGFRDFMLGKHKHLMANANTILIDDNDDNVAKFSRNGGHGILFPQRWNLNARKQDRIQFVREELERICAL